MGHFQKYYNICLISYPSILQFFKWSALNLFSSKSKQNTMVGNLWLYEWSMLIFVPWGFSTYFIMPSTISKHTTPIHVISQRVEMTFENDLSVLFIDFGIFGNSPWKNRKKLSQKYSSNNHIAILGFGSIHCGRAQSGLSQYYESPDWPLPECIYIW